MCLVAFAYRQHPRYPLAVIANRDELHARPTAIAGVDAGDRDLYGGRDLAQGGGWLMVSRRGRLAAVTNVRVPPLGARFPRSRGALVRDFVADDAGVDAFLDGLAPEAGNHGPFNLVLWDGQRMACAGNHPGFARQAVAPGLHAVSNGPFDAPWPKSNLASRALSAWIDNGLPADARGADVAPLLDALADQTPAPDPALPDTGVGLALGAAAVAAVRARPRLRHALQFDRAGPGARHPLRRAALRARCGSAGRKRRLVAARRAHGFVRTGPTIIHIDDAGH